MLLLQLSKGFKSKYEFMKADNPSCLACQVRHKGLFNSCEKHQLQLMSDDKSCRLYKKGETIFVENNRAYGLHCIMEGKVKLLKGGSEGKDQIVRLARHGDALGFRAMLTNQRYTASAVALDDCKVCFLPTETFLSIVEQNNTVASELMRMLSKALNEAEEQLTNLATKPVRERLADSLLLLKRVYGEDQEQDFTISISREDLASMVGTAKETVIRFLSELKDEGIVSAKGSNITIHHPDRLVAISHLYD